MNNNSSQNITKQDLIEILDDRFAKQDERIDQKFVAQDKRNNQRFDSIDKKFMGIDRRFDSIDQRFKVIDKRFEGIDKRFNSIDQRFINIDQKFLETDKKTDAKFDELAIMINNSVNELLKIIQINYLHLMQEIHDLQATKANVVYRFEFNDLKNRVDKLEDRIG